jgi:hypothetical protein
MPVDFEKWSIVIQAGLMMAAMADAVESVNTGSQNTSYIRLFDGVV